MCVWFFWMKSAVRADPVCATTGVCRSNKNTHTPFCHFFSRFHRRIYTHTLYIWLQPLTAATHTCWERSIRYLVIILSLCLHWLTFVFDKQAIRLHPCVDLEVVLWTQTLTPLCLSLSTKVDIVLPFFLHHELFRYWLDIRFQWHSTLLSTRLSTLFQVPLVISSSSSSSAPQPTISFFKLVIHGPLPLSLRLFLLLSLVDLLRSSPCPSYFWMLIP